jgi:hypothetical protein
MVGVNDDALAYIAITRLQRAYADIATRKAYAEIAALATPDARFSFDTRTGDVIEVVGADAFGRFATRSTDRFRFYEYVPLNTVVKIDAAGTARGRSYSFEICEDRDTRELLTYYGMYHDDYVRVDGNWLFARRQYQTIGRRTGQGLMESYPLNDRGL